METREKKEGTVTFWDNVRKLVQIYIMHQKKPWITSVLVTGIFLLVVSVCTLIAFIHRVGIQRYYILGGYGGIVAVGILIILARSHTLLANEHISMYPGNAMSRYLGRVIVDHGYMLAYTVFVGLFYVLQSGVLWLFLHGIAGVDTGQLFDIRYLGLGMLRIYLIWMMLYGVLAVINAIVAKWGFRGLVGIGGVFVAGVWYMAFCHFDRLVQLEIWWNSRTTENTNAVSYVGFCLAVWLICMLVATMITSRIRMWKKSNPGVYLAIFSLLCLASGGTMLSASIYTEEAIVLLGEEVSYDQMEPLHSQALVELPQNCADMVNSDPGSFSMVNEDGKIYDSMTEYFDVGYEYTITCVSEAVEDGVVPEGTDLSGVDEEHALYVYEVPNVRLHGQELYRDFMDGLPERLVPVYGQKQYNMEYHGPWTSVIYNNYFPGVDRFLYHGDQDITMEEYYQDQPVWKVAVVLSDNRYAEADAE